MSNKIFKDFEKAIKRLKEVLSLRKNKIRRDSAIKRFELCFDLAWKSTKIYAKSQGAECYSPRECFKAAFQLKLIDYQKDWIEMIDDRNLATHLYSEEYADKIYSRLRDYLKLFKELSIRLKQVKLK